MTLTLKEFYWINQQKNILYCNVNLSLVSAKCEEIGKGYIEYNKEYKIFVLLE